jgi:hypothetical protein
MACYGDSLTFTYFTIRTSLGLDDTVFHYLLTYYSLCFDEKFLVKTSMRVLSRRLQQNKDNMKDGKTTTSLYLLLAKNIKIRAYKTIILPVVLYGYESWFLTLRKEHRLRVFENRVLRRILGPMIG